MDQLQVRDLILSYLESQGITDNDLIRKGCLEAAVLHLAENPFGASFTTLEKVRQLWGLDVAPAVSSYLNKKADEYENTDLTAKEVLLEIASNPVL